MKFSDGEVSLIIEEKVNEGYECHLVDGTIYLRKQVKENNAFVTEELRFTRGRRARYYTLEIATWEDFFDSEFDTEITFDEDDSLDFEFAV